MVFGNSNMLQPSHNTVPGNHKISNLNEKSLIKLIDLVMLLTIHSPSHHPTIPPFIILILSLILILILNSNFNFSINYNFNFNNNFNLTLNLILTITITLPTIRLSIHHPQYPHLPSVHPSIRHPSMSIHHPISNIHHPPFHMIHTYK